MIQLLSLLACSMAGQWDKSGSDPSADDSGVDSTDDTAPAAATLVISELMKDPDAVSDDFGEWFELTNIGPDVDLNGLEVQDADGNGFVVAGALAMASGTQRVFAVSADAAANGGVTPDYVYDVADLKLSNEGGSITLILGGRAVDTVAWDSLPAVKGHAIALDPDALDPERNDLAESWCAAGSPYGDGDFGTPGTANESCSGAPPDADGDGVTDADDCDPGDGDVYAGADEQADGKDNDCDGWTDERAPAPGDLVITEIMDDPDPTDDDDGEWFEILNVSRDTLELTGVTFSDESGEMFAIEAPAEVSMVLEPEDILLFGASDNTSKNGGFVPDYLFDTSVFHLSNDTDEILLEVDGVLIDAVAYDNDFPHEKGKSRSVDPIGMSSTRNDDADYWCEGDGDYGTDENQGTPGTPNDSCPA